MKIDALFDSTGDEHDVEEEKRFFIINQFIHRVQIDGKRLMQSAFLSCNPTRLHGVVTLSKLFWFLENCDHFGRPDVLRTTNSKSNILSYVCDNGAIWTGKHLLRRGFERLILTLLRFMWKIIIKSPFHSVGTVIN